MKRSHLPSTLWLGLLSLICFAGLAAGSSKAADKRYVVKKNDTLTQIARQYGVSVPALIKHNKLAEPNRIHPGDVLRIPGGAAAAARPALDAELQKKLDRIRVAAKTWKHIVIHHSATDSGDLKGMDRYHREERHMENGLAYHFLIGNGKGMGDGAIAIGRRWTEQLAGGHLASQALNENSIGICLVGNFEADRPTDKQLDSLHALASYLLKRARLSPRAVKTHQQINPIYTECPGRHFPAGTFLKELD